MKNLIYILTLCGIWTNTYSQSSLIWSKDFNTRLLNYYECYPTIKTDRDTIKVMGWTNTPIGQRLLILKYDLNGNVISSLTYGNDLVINNKLIDYKFDSSNHVYLLQKELLGFYKSKIVLQKYSMDGSLIWVQQIQDPADTSYSPHSIALANDSSFFITAYKEYDYPELGDDVIFTQTFSYLYAYDSNGNQLWQRAFNPDNEIKLFDNDIFINNNTAFLFAYNSSFNRCLVKVDVNNNFTIKNNINIQGGINDIQLTLDNNLLISAAIQYRISKLNLNGSLIWAKYYGTNLPSNESGDEIRSTIQDANGNIYVTGRHCGENSGTPSYTNADILTLKYDSNGNLIWQNRYEYLVDNADVGNTIVLKNGNIYVGGESERSGVPTDYDYVAIKMDSASGITTGEYRYNGLENENDVVTSLFVFNNNKVALTGLSFINSQYNWTTQFLSDILLSNKGLFFDNKIEIFPNPILNGSSLKINGNNFQEYSLISSIGQIVQQGKFGKDESQTLNLQNVSSGIYVLQLKSKNEVCNKKLIVN